MHKQAALVVLLMIAAPLPLSAQEPGPGRFARNTLSLEIMGHGGAYSIGYERLLGPTFALRAGLSYYNFEGGQVTVDGMEGFEEKSALWLTLLPLTASWLRGHTHHLELGGGPVLGYARLDVAELGSGSDVLFALSGLAGYRYQRPGGGVFFRAAYTPMWSGGVLSPLWFGFAIGYTF
ncbi:MAG TPA: hypothetical protein VF158_08790 [Longimicrobiales bacterium]